MNSLILLGKEKITNSVYQLVKVNITGSIKKVLEIVLRDWEIRDTKFSVLIDNEYFVGNVDIDFNLLKLEKTNIIDFINNIIKVDRLGYVEG
ncbi:hypothetical protein CDJ58_03855 [Campylobacter lari]|nr:hypothetical protein [Campylobacter lari]EAK5748534.1 hypothetical protein [Campylobacter lari]EAK9878196.1 hypothetical protein [Campylobacter lari]